MQDAAEGQIAEFQERWKAILDRVRKTSPPIVTKVASFGHKNALFIKVKGARIDHLRTARLNTAKNLKLSQKEMAHRFTGALKDVEKVIAESTEE